MEEDIKMYTVIVDGIEIKSSGPITEEMARKKLKTMQKVARQRQEDCEDCEKKQINITNVIER